MVVFVVGGGSYVEYESVREWAKSRGLHRVTYGSTEMITAEQFVNQVSHAGQSWWIRQMHMFFKLSYLGK